MNKSFLLLLGFFAISTAFAPSSTLKSSSSVQADRRRLFSSEGDTTTEERRNPDRPELPEIKGDYNWDEKFANDPEWITENVPGKVVLSDIELAAQVSALSQIEEKYRKQRLQKEYDDARILGWTSRAETFNGRAAMFFLVVGLLTEYWTGITIPGQIEEMARVGGFIGPDY